MINMLQIIIFILITSLILYTLLGGADFGAGIIEMLAGRREERTISKAMAPVWEANHIWLILAIVIIFTGFPQVYADISTYLHIPLMVMLMGIVMRGSSFIFRYYDIEDKRSHRYYTFFFDISSFITPLFLGITFGAVMLGDISAADATDFYSVFIAPWFNPFCIAVGLFFTALFGYIAAAFLIGETKHADERKRYVRLSKIFLAANLILSALIFLIAEVQGRHLLQEFVHHTAGFIAFSIVALLIPFILYLFEHPRIWYLRAAIGLQVSLIVLGWFALQYPVLLYEQNGNDLTFFNAHAPEATLRQLLIALLVGLALIIPSFYFLFTVFKKNKTV